MTHEKTEKKRAALRTIAMPADTNSNGDIFGGWILSQMDVAGALVAADIAKKRIATVGIEEMSFHKPVFVGDEVSCYGEVKKIGTTSITIHVETWVRRIRKNEESKVTEGAFTYVAIDENRHPVPIKD